jgi:hypothetical protein
MLGQVETLAGSKLRELRTVGLLIQNRGFLSSVLLRKPVRGLTEILKLCSTRAAFCHVAVKKLPLGRTELMRRIQSTHQLVPFMRFGSRFQVMW